MYEQNCKNFNRLRYKQHSTIAMLLTSWSFLLAKPYGKKHKLLRSGWPAAAPVVVVVAALVVALALIL